jgi:hypothetical protein
LGGERENGEKWHVVHARNLEEENKLIEARFEYVQYGEKDNMVINRKRKQWTSQVPW